MPIKNDTTRGGERLELVKQLYNFCEFAVAKIYLCTLPCLRPLYNFAIPRRILRTDFFL